MKELARVEDVTMTVYYHVSIKDFGTPPPEINMRVAYGFGPRLAVVPRVLEES